jgi:CO/xanthine dehydrogenase Mo-binding subunit
MPELDVVGKDAAAVRSHEVVSGHARFVADIWFPRMLVGKLLYTAHPCASIRELKVETARGLPGVVAVLTHADIPGENSYCHILADQPLLARDRVRFQGDALAAVAAEDEDGALAALKAIRVEYEPVQGVFDVLEAMKPDAPQVWPGRSNVVAHWVIERGNLEEGFRTADVVIENTYRTQMVEQAFLEPEGAVARTNEEGMIVVYSSCQAPHSVRRQIARALRLPEHRIRVVVPHVGGAFGGKSEAHVEIHAALLAMKTGRPVRIVRTREESIQTHGKRHPMIIRYRTGAKANGLLTAIHVEAIGDTGPYVGSGMQVMGAFTETSSGPYSVPNVRQEAYTVLTNNPTCGAMRGFGIPQACLASEAQMDNLARALDMDPLDIRLLNGLTTGSILPTGAIIREGSDMKESLREVSRLIGWEERDRQQRQPAPHQIRGWGLASTWHLMGFGGKAPNHAGVILDMAEDGSVILRTGVVEMGQGTHTALAQIAAEALGTRLSSVRVIGPDTDTTVDTGSTEASRAVYISGNAVLRAAEPIRLSLLETAAEETGLPIDVLSLRGDRLYAGNEEISVTVPELARKAWMRNRQLHADGFYAMERPEGYPAEGAFPFSHQAFIFGAHAAKVLVDIETGKVTVEEVVAVHGAGRVINPRGAHGQLAGGCAMGIGYCLLEELIAVQGRTVNNTLEAYTIPTALDVPGVRVGILETAEPYGPFGAKGLGEPATNATAPAILNAVVDAIGTPLHQIPLTPERVLAAIAGRSGCAAQPMPEIGARDGRHPSGKGSTK